jgi:hypothetical protein
MWKYCDFKAMKKEGQLYHDPWYHEHPPIFLQSTRPNILNVSNLAPGNLRETAHHSCEHICAEEEAR